jgi:hypothetical protein
MIKFISASIPIRDKSSQFLRIFQIKKNLICFLIPPFKPSHSDQILLIAPLLFDTAASMLALSEVEVISVFEIAFFTTREIPSLVALWPDFAESLRCSRILCRFLARKPHALGRETVI